MNERMGKVISEAVVKVVEECSHKSFENMPFPEVIGRLMEAGVERYDADLCRHTKTFYMPDGASRVVCEAEDFEQSGLARVRVAENFSGDGVRAAVRAIQQKQIGYAEFVRQIMAAGAVSYFVYLTGKKAVYVSREGETYTECFPGAQQD